MPYILLWAPRNLEVTLAAALVASNLVACWARCQHWPILRWLMLTLSPSTTLAKFAAPKESGDSYFFLSISDGLLELNAKLITLTA